MKTVETNILSESSNSPVIQLPTRNFPGVVVQGDSLKILCSRAEELRDNLSGKKRTDNPIDLANELVDLLQGYLSNYIDALEKNNMDTSFFK